MKKLIVLIVIQLLIVNHAWGQKGYSHFYNKHRYNQGIESFELSNSLFRFFLNKSESEKTNLLRNIDNISFFISDSMNAGLFEELNNNISGNSYKDIIVIIDKDSSISFKAKESKNGIEEILMIVTEPDSFTVMCITGFLSFNETESLINSIDINQSPMY